MADINQDRYGASDKGDTVVDTFLRSASLSERTDCLTQLLEEGYTNPRMIDFFVSSIGDYQLESFANDPKETYIKRLRGEEESHEPLNPEFVEIGDGVLLELFDEEPFDDDDLDHSVEDLFDDVESEQLPETEMIEQERYADILFKYEDWLRGEFPEVRSASAQRILDLANNIPDDAGEEDKAYAANVLGSWQVYSPKLSDWLVDEGSLARLSSVQALKAVERLNDKIFALVDDADDKVAEAAEEALSHLLICDLDSTETVDQGLVDLLHHDNRHAKAYALRKIREIVSYRLYQDGAPRSTDPSYHPSEEDLRKIIPGKSFDDVVDAAGSFLQGEDNFLISHSLSLFMALDHYHENISGIFGRKLPAEVKLKGLTVLYKLRSMDDVRGVAALSDTDFRKYIAEQIGEESRYIFMENNMGLERLWTKTRENSPSARRYLFLSLATDEDSAAALLVDPQLNKERDSVLNFVSAAGLYFPKLVPMLDSINDSYSYELAYFETIFDNIGREDYPLLSGKLLPLLEDHENSHSMNATLLLARMGIFDKRMAKVFDHVNVNARYPNQRDEVVNAFLLLYSNDGIDDREISDALAEQIDAGPLSFSMWTAASAFHDKDERFLDYMEGFLAGHDVPVVMGAIDYGRAYVLLDSIGRFLSKDKEKSRERGDYDDLLRMMRNIAGNRFSFSSRASEDFENSLRFKAYKTLLSLDYFTSELFELLNENRIGLSGQISFYRTTTTDLLDSMEEIAVSGSFPVVDMMCNRLFRYFIGKRGVGFSDNSRSINFYENTADVIHLLKMNHPCIVEKYIPHILASAEEGSNADAALLLLKLDYYDFDILRYEDASFGSYHMNEKGRMMMCSSNLIGRHLEGMPQSMLLDIIDKKLAKPDDELRKTCYDTDAYRQKLRDRAEAIKGGS